MDEITRRAALRLTAGLGAPGVAGASLADDKPFDNKGEKARIMEAGLTEAEADCWLAIADAAGKFFQLPKLHPLDAQEVATAIHVVQHKLLARPTYRKYLELAKAAAGKKG
jgi:hypothetical protein